MKILSVLLIALFCSSNLAFAQESLTTQVEAIPRVFKVTPSGVATLKASRYMYFSDCKGEPACCDILTGANGKSLQYKKDGTYKHTPNGEPQFVPIADSAGNNALEIIVPVDPAYRVKGNILITWTLRIEGRDDAIINPWGTLCGSWHGTVTETFKGGHVYSQAYVDMGSGYKARGQAAVMTIPDGGSGLQRTIHDPTHSGSYLLKASDFKNGFPAKVKIQIYWKNDTSMIITSSDAYRSLIVTLLPTN